MLTLKNYQKRAVQDFEKYLDNIDLMSVAPVPHEAAFLLMHLVGGYDNALNVPFVCIKIPTGGGKTIVACHILNSIYSKNLISKNDKGLVLWLVPTDIIKTQTLEALKNPNHDYRKVLDSKFSNNVKIFNFKEILTLSKPDLQNNLCILVTTVASFRTQNKEKRKAWKSNGSLKEHFKKKDPTVELIENEDKQTNHLFNAIRLSKPVIVIDEGHNTKTILSHQMFKDLNPSFVVEYTATPRRDRSLPSNVLVDVKGDELKAEHMVKLPINLINITKWQETIRYGVDKRKTLSKDALKIKNEYIRPIALIQAQQDVPHTKKIHVEQIKQFLISDCKIKEKEIAIKTGTKDEISHLDLYSKKCPVNYIITVKALQEGWDNPFAYVLISVANIGAEVAVEQIVGRVLRLPTVTPKKIQSLNESYVFTSSHNFTKAVESVKKGLEANGFSANSANIIKSPSDPKTSNNSKIKRRFVPKVTIPFITIKKTKSPISYHTDLIEKTFTLNKQGVSSKFSTVNENKFQKIDIEKGGAIITSTKQSSTNVLYQNKDFKQENLIVWLDQRIRKKNYEQAEKRKYILKFIKSMIKNTKYTLKDLAINCHVLQNEIEKKISEVELKKAEKTWKKLITNKALSLSQIHYKFPTTMILENTSPDKFNRHLYEKAGNMNKEEYDLATKIDLCKDNVKWWYRNIEKKNFFIQGWEPRRFFPDFIIETKKGKIIIVEYKGGHLISNDDTNYKKKLGFNWAELAGKNYQFYVIGKGDVNAFIDKLKKN